jgi:hypothetical protein
MIIYSEELAKASQWIWKHRDEPQYWEWHDLTARNPASDTLNMPDTVAWNIFTILEQRGLMVPFEVKKEGKTFPAFKLNPDKEDEWNKAKTLPTKWDKKLWEPLTKLGINLWTFLVWILSLVIASALTYGAERLIDWKWPTTP